MVKILAFLMVLAIPAQAQILGQSDLLRSEMSRSRVEQSEPQRSRVEQSESFRMRMENDYLRNENQRLRNENIRKDFELLYDSDDPPMDLFDRRK